MILFWSLVTVMVVAAVVAVVPALLGRVRVPGTDHTATNIAVFRDRLAELRADRDQGSLTEAQFEEARAELEQEFAEEVPAGTGDAGPARDPKRGRWALGLVAVATPVLALAVYLSLGRPGLVAQPPATRMAEQQFRQFAQMPTAERIPALKRFLDERPRAGEAWFLLAQSYSQRSQFGDAVEAFAKARQYIGDDTPMSARLLAGYAQALALSNDRQITDRVLDLATLSLEQDPDNQIALWLMGSGAMQAGDGQRASEYFRRLARQFPAGSDSAGMLKEYIAQAEGVSPDQVSLDRPEPEASGPKLTVRVSLSGNLAPQADPDDAVFIFARSPEGPPMPVAAVRKTVADLPAEVTLSDAQAMTPQRKLSQQDQVVVGARISKSGRPMASSGDLQGLSEPMAVEDGGQVTITIDSKVP